MIAKGNRSTCPLWTLGEMMRTMSEFLMLATSRSPAQWVTSQLPLSVGSNGDVSDARNSVASGNRPSSGKGESAATRKNTDTHLTLVG